MSVDSNKTKSEVSQNWELQKIQSDITRDWGIEHHVREMHNLEPKSDEYQKRYATLQGWIPERIEKLKEIWWQHKDRASDEFANQIADMATRLKQIQADFNALPKPGSEPSWEQETSQSKPENLWFLEPNTDFSEISLHGTQIAGIEPQRYLAKSIQCEYYLVSIPNFWWGVMRIPTGKGKIAFLHVNGDHDWEQLIQIIRGSELSGGFQNIHIEGTAHTKTGAAVGTLALPVTGTLMGAIGGHFIRKNLTTTIFNELGMSTKFTAIQNNPKS